MNKDLMYYFDKTSPYQRHELGEIQSDFNMGFAIDGSKDTCKIVVLSFNENELEPNTILWHEKTNSWWCVKRDRTNRYLNDNGDFIYEHALQLEGAIEWFNSRDLTDCGFNQDEYTINEFLERLISLSNVEIPLWGIVADSNFLSQKVTYVKAFENYTLLSALREFLDGYNMCAKLHFRETTSDNNTFLSECVLSLFSKTGSRDLTAHNISEFNEVKETKTIDINSFGTTVVSNVENVVASDSKTFPSTGAVKTSSNEYNILAQNALIRLPTKVYKGNWIKLVLPKGAIEMEFVFRNSGGNTTMRYDTIKMNVSSQGSISKAFYTMQQYVAYWCNLESGGNEFYQAFAQALAQQKQNIIDNVTKASTITIYNGNEIDTVNETIIKGKNVPYLAHIDYVSHINVQTQEGANQPVIFCDKAFKQALPQVWKGIQWERGSDVISGFDGFVPLSRTSGSWRINANSYTNTDLQQSSMEYFRYETSLGHVILRTPTNDVTVHFRDTQWVVNYIPMTDLKIKVNNNNRKRDTLLYNQNGKFTDGVALSKVINSYAKEVSSNTITRYKAYTNYDLVPKAGSFVITPNGEYVVSNISLDFSQSENSNNDFTYFIECEITMSKAVAIKTIMVNPNTNIRDYGIPQQYNVKRKQIYRDFVELTYSLESTETPYMSPEKYLGLGLRSSTFSDLVAVMKLNYDEQINGSSTYYYQLDTVNYNFEKSLYIVCDFKDNNIIGYGSQNVFSGFVISRILSGTIDTINTPISYVDSNGKVKDIDILLVDNETLTSVYDTYQSQSGGDSWDGVLYNFSVFIPSDIYDGCFGRQTIRINETNYKKDAIEVPVFEYSAQIEDSNDVLVGSNILKQYDGCVYLYSYILGQNLNQNNVFESQNALVSSSYAQVDNSVAIGYYVVGTDQSGLSYDHVKVRLYELTQYSFNTNSVSYENQLVIPANTDIAIFRHVVDPLTKQVIAKELIAILKNVQNGGQEINLAVNTYKLN